MSGAGKGKKGKKEKKGDEGQREVVKDGGKSVKDQIQEECERGYHKGFGEGKGKGYDQGKDKGWEKGSDRGWEKGHTDGWLKGYREGKGVNMEWDINCCGAKRKRGH